MTTTSHIPQTTASAVDVQPVTAVIGAEIHGVDLSQPLDDTTVSEIRNAWLRWKVVFFRDQHITAAQQIAFGRRFGTLTPSHPVRRGADGTGSDEHPEIYRLDVADQYARARRAPDTMVEPGRGWHTDITFVPNPALGSILRGVVIPPYGGDTLFTNLVAAYAALSPTVRAFVDGLHAVHRWNYDDEIAEDGSVKAPRSAVHPVVRVHPETGERALFVNPVFTSHIVGLTARESHDILELLYSVIMRPDLAVRFRWAPDSIAFWDNRATAHMGPVDAAHAELQRVVERVTLTGDVPVGPDGFRSHALTGERFE